MKIKNKSDYPRNGKQIFVSRVSGTKEELAKYKEVQGENYREDEDGTPLHYSTGVRHADGSALKLTRAGDKFFVDQSEKAKNISLVAQYPGPIGDALAAQIAAKLLNGNTASATATAPVEAAADNIGEM